MDIDHVSPPVVLSRERLAAGLGVGACANGAVEFLRLLVLVVDVTIQVGLGSKSLATSWVRALMRPFMVSFMMTVQVRTGLSRFCAG